MGSFNLNQFGLTDKAGKTMNVNPNTIAARVSKDIAAALNPGDGVKFVTTEVGAAPVVTIIAAGDYVDGIVLDNPRQASFAAKQMVEIGMPGTIVTMTAGAAFNRGDVYYDPATGYVCGTSGTIRHGRSLDIASAVGDIVRVEIKSK